MAAKGVNQKLFPLNNNGNNAYMLKVMKIKISNRQVRVRLQKTLLLSASHAC